MISPKALRLLALLTLVISGEGAFPDCTNGPLATNLVCDPTASPVDRAKALVAEFTAKELSDNMVDVSPGVPRLGLPAYLWWSEALHGVSHVPLASAGQSFSNITTFPAPITIGAAFDDALLRSVADAISTEARALANNAHAGFDFFTPNINPFKDPRWGRGQETPGEDAFHVAQYAFNYVSTLQGGVAPDPFWKVMAVCKHWAAYDLENVGSLTRHTFDAIVSPQDLAEYYSPPFQSCVRDAGGAGVMCSYNSVNGVPSCANQYLLKDLLRDLWGLGNEKWVVSDCAALTDIYNGHKYTTTGANATALALKAGTDIECGSEYRLHLPEALNQSLVSIDDLRLAVTRQYTSLIKTGYFDAPANDPFRKLGAKDINTANAHNLAYEAAVAGTVLLKNDGVLPLKSSVKNIALIGPWANATNQMQSNYAGPPPFLISPLQAFRTAGMNVTFALGTSINSNSTSQFAAALTAARAADVVVYLGGIDGSIEGESRDRTTITWPGNQLDLVGQLANVGKPLVVLQMGGGQIDSSALKSNPKVNALVWGGYPGQSGGTALLDVLTGKRSPAGRLPITQYPANYVNQVALTDMTLRPSSKSPGRTYKWYTGTPVFEFGAGLHYTTFDFAWADGKEGKTYDIRGLVQAASASGVDHVDRATLDTIPVSVKNTGSVKSDYVALLFSRTTAGPAPAPLKELVSYSRVKDVAPGASATAELTITLGAIGRTDEQGNKVLYPGSYELMLDTAGVIKKNITLTGTQATLLAWPKAP